MLIEDLMIIMRKTLNIGSVFFLLVMPLCIYAQPEPRWVNYALRDSQYPSSRFLTGFASEINNQNADQNELLSRLELLSKDQLVENIMVDIRSISTLNIHNVNTATQETFKHNSTSFSQAKISGLKVEKYYDAKKKVAYAFAFAEKGEVIKLYTNEIDKEIGNIQTAIASAKGLEKQAALKKYFETQPAFRTIEEAQTLIVTLTANFEDPSLKRTVVNELKVSVDKSIDGLRSSDKLTIDEAANYLAFGFNLQSGEIKTPVKLANFTYQDTPMGSPFSRRFKSMLEQSLINEAHYNIVDPSAKTPGLVLTGTYWEDGDRLKITGMLRDEVSGDAIASASCFIPLSTLQQNDVDFKPENYKDAMTNMKMFAKDELKGGELKVDILTNKGKEGQIYSEGETMKLFVRANRECYVRFIYHLADGNKVLLLDNYYINRDKVNQVYELPYTFECAGPFGVETLQLNAQTEMFEPLTVRSEDGYDFIQENTEQILVKTRGFKKKEGEVLKAEEIVMFTTMKSL
jgi:hypothetical protein